MPTNTWTANPDDEVDLDTTTTNRISPRTLTSVPKVETDISKSVLNPSAPLFVPRNAAKTQQADKGEDEVHESCLWEDVPEDILNASRLSATVPCNLAPQLSDTILEAYPPFLDDISSMISKYTYEMESEGKLKELYSS